MSKPAAPAPYFGNSRPEVAVLLPERVHHVLEIGCGEGRFAGHLRQRQSYWGVEPSAAAAEQAATRLDHVLHGTFEGVREQLPERHFDLVICNDVIEHMPDHDAFLEDIKPKLVPGALIVGSVPNVRYLPHLVNLLLRRDWRYEAEGVLDRTHLRFFTATSLRRTLEQHGYEIEQLTGLNSVLSQTRLRSRLRWGATLILMQMLTLRGQADCRYLQLGFRLRWPG